MCSRFISFGVYRRIPEVVDAGRMPRPRHVVAPVSGDTKMRVTLWITHPCDVLVDAEESSSWEKMRETPRRQALDLEKYSPHRHHPALRAQIAIISKTF